MPYKSVVPLTDGGNAFEEFELTKKKLVVQKKF